VAEEKIAAIRVLSAQRAREPQAEPRQFPESARPVCAERHRPYRFVVAGELSLLAAGDQVPSRATIAPAIATPSASFPTLAHSSRAGAGSSAGVWPVQRPSSSAAATAS
jgi:hypothetical protein